MSMTPSRWRRGRGTKSGYGHVNIEPLAVPEVPGLGIAIVLAVTMEESRSHRKLDRSIMICIFRDDYPYGLYIVTMLGQLFPSNSVGGEMISIGFG